MYSTGCHLASSTVFHVTYAMSHHFMAVNVYTITVPCIHALLSSSQNMHCFQACGHHGLIVQQHVITEHSTGPEHVLQIVMVELFKLEIVIRVVVQVNLF